MWTTKPNDKICQRSHFDFAISVGLFVSLPHAKKIAQAIN